MKINEILKEEVLTRSALPMGLSQYVSSSYALVGGGRSGSSSAGTTRLKYDIYDLELYEKDPENAVVGTVEVFVDDTTGKIKGLVNIKLTTTNRKAGYGSSIINDLVDTAGGELEIHDIKPPARGFWQKMGIEYHTASKKGGIIRN